MLAGNVWYLRNVSSKNCPYLTLTTIGWDWEEWEEDTIQMSMILNLMPMLHVLHTKEITSMHISTNNCSGHIFTGGVDVRYSLLAFQR